MTKEAHNHLEVCTGFYFCVTAYKSHRRIKSHQKDFAMSIIKSVLTIIKLVTFMYENHVPITRSF